MATMTIALLTLREASRRRLLLAVAALTVLCGLLSGWAFHRLMEIPCGPATAPHPCSSGEHAMLAASLLIILLFMFSFVLAVGAAFLGAPAVANDVESGIVLAILPRPIRRSNLVLGKWLGLAILLALYAGVSCGLELLIVRFAMNFAPPHPVLSVLFIVAESLVILTLAIALSTRVPAMTSGIAILVLFGLIWIGGVTGNVGMFFHNQTIENIGTISSLILPTDGLWRAAIYNLEPAVLLDVSQNIREGGNPFLALSAPTIPYLLWALCWTLAVLGIGLWSFERRDL